jgi:hypothetical protein
VIKDFEWKKAIGHYLLKAKYLVLQFCEDDKPDRPKLDKLREELRELAQSTDVRHLPDYAPVHEGRLLASLDQLQTAKLLLENGKFVSGNVITQPVEVNASTALNSHAWQGATGCHFAGALRNLRILVCVDEQRTDPHDVFGLAPAQVCFVDANKCSDAAAGSVELQNAGQNSSRVP